MLTPPIRLRMIRFGTFQIDPDNREPCITRPSADWHSFPELEREWASVHVREFQAKSRLARFDEPAVASGF